MRLLATGGCGFIGSNFIRRYLARYPADTVLNFDKLTYAGRGNNLADMADRPQYGFVQGDIADRAQVLAALDGVDAVVNFAAETHVDRSILDAQAFLQTNVLGLHTLLEAVRERRVPRLLHVSTDEVYGSLPDGSATEESPLAPSSPYAASKAAGDLLVRAYVQTHRLPAVIVRPANNFGPHQFPEKLIPLGITNLLEGKKVPVYGDGRQVRDWLFVDDCCDAIDLVLQRGTDGHVYNIAAGNEQENLSVIGAILRAVGRDDSAIEWVRDRPGHDRRYSSRADRLHALGWRPQATFADALQVTVRWYRNHEAWWRPLKDRAFEEYYRRQYARG